MSSKAAGVKTLRLMSLENWARSKYVEERFTSREFKDAMEEYCLITWGVSDSAADNMARIVQLRLTRRMPKSIEAPPEPLPEDGDDKRSIFDIIQAHKDANPAEYHPRPADFPIIDEADQEDELGK